MRSGRVQQEPFFRRLHSNRNFSFWSICLERISQHVKPEFVETSPLKKNFQQVDINQHLQEHRQILAAWQHQIQPALAQHKTSARGSSGKQNSIENETAGINSKFFDTSWLGYQVGNTFCMRGNIRNLAFLLVCARTSVLPGAVTRNWPIWVGAASNTPQYEDGVVSRNNVCCKKLQIQVVLWQVGSYKISAGLSFSSAEPDVPRP